jgi:hypothetical protein
MNITGQKADDPGSKIQESLRNSVPRRSSISSKSEVSPTVHSLSDKTESPFMIETMRHFTCHGARPFMVQHKPWKSTTTKHTKSDLMANFPKGDV